MNYQIDVTCGCGSKLMQSSMQQWTYWCMNNECRQTRMTLKLKLDIEELDDCSICEGCYNCTGEVEQE